MSERFDADGRALYPWEVSSAPAEAPTTAPEPEPEVDDLDDEIVLDEEYSEDDDEE